MFKRIVVVDSAVRNRFGHFFVHTKGIIDAAKVNDIPVLALVNRDCDNAAEEIGATRALTFPAWGNEKLASFSYAALWTNANMAVAGSLEGVKHLIGPDDLIVMHSASPNELFGIYKWFASFPLPKPKIFLCLHAPATYYGALEDQDVASILFRRALRLWAEPIKHGEAVMASTNSTLSKAMQADANAPIHVMPLIVPVFKFRQRQPSDRINFLFSGFLREKGLGTLIQAIQMLRPSSATFTLHVANENIASQCQNLIGNRLDVQILNKPLSSVDYDSLVSDCDAMLLPYEIQAYRARHSSMFFEALGSGRPVVVTPRTPLSDDLIEAGLPGVVAKDDTPSCISEAVEKLAAEFNVRRTIASCLSDQLARRLSAPAYVERLAGWLGT